MIRVGVIGCGSIGRVHAGILKDIKEVILCAMVDPKLDRAEEFSQVYTERKANVYGSFEAMAEKESLDVVHICTPHSSHVPLAVAALKLGMHVFMEKPPAINREQFQRLLIESRRSSGRVGICFQNRYNETTEKVTELLKAGVIGTIKGGRVFVTWHRDASYYTESGWRGQKETEGGGVLINQSIHALDLLLGWLGKPIRTEASMSNHHLKGIIEVEDTFHGYMEFTQGKDPVSACFYATTAYAADAPVMIELVGENGFIRIEGEQLWYQGAEQTEPVLWKSLKRMVPGKSYWGSGHQACIRDFYECLQTGKDYRNDLASVQTTFDTMMNLYESARNERE
ncbi:Gfo/Idh/MocA family oxidoreductase [Clostridium sp. E02]|uniref:Gfo/Idh/MocA family protein n=1 Tax=Clostridium sp. E02 TaxID=2487134 RepID=UPI0013DE1A63|nr:Gfo/Idh/MocA family oxidoreductase [Clostridium sp. E02]